VDVVGDWFGSEVDGGEGVFEATLEIDEPELSAGCAYAPTKESAIERSVKACMAARTGVSKRRG
jgi:hypothetical protein